MSRAVKGAEYYFAVIAHICVCVGSRAVVLRFAVVHVLLDTAEYQRRYAARNVFGGYGYPVAAYSRKTVLESLHRKSRAAVVGFGRYLEFYFATVPYVGIRRHGHRYGKVAYVVIDGYVLRAERSYFARRILRFAPQNERIFESAHSAAFFGHSDKDTVGILALGVHVENVTAFVELRRVAGIRGVIDVEVSRLIGVENDTDIVGDESALVGKVEVGDLFAVLILGMRAESVTFERIGVDIDGDRIVFAHARARSESERIHARSVHYRGERASVHRHRRDGGISAYHRITVYARNGDVGSYRDEYLSRRPVCRSELYIGPVDRGSYRRRRHGGVEFEGSGAERYSRAGLVGDGSLILSHIDFDLVARLVVNVERDALTVKYAVDGHLVTHVARRRAVRYRSVLYPLRGSVARNERTYLVFVGGTEHRRHSEIHFDGFA